MRQCMDAENLHRRLKKILGQVQAIDRMIDEDVPCEDVLAQINAAKSALHGCGRVVLEGQSNTVCVTALNMVMPTKPLTVLPRRLNASPT